MKQSYPPVTTKRVDVKKIAKRLIMMAKRDQEVRDKYFALNDKKYLDEMWKIDEKNQREFKEIFRQVGLITSEYGSEAQMSAFLIVQHMSREEVKFMKNYLSLMKKNITGYPLNIYAMLVDRVRNWEGKDQLYGTQFMPVEGKENTYKLKKLYKSHLVEKRRMELGLEPLGEYIKKLQEERGVTLIL
ncbi:MAG TPA: hypothetical protein PLV59_02160 [Candidatus Dojkabacteria bacterium]|nr:hypothetical protein [Candidatus Dojkabacteria bacterium]